MKLTGAERKLLQEWIRDNNWRLRENWEKLCEVILLVGQGKSEVFIEGCLLDAVLLDVLRESLKTQELSQKYLNLQYRDNNAKRLKDLPSIDQRTRTNIHVALTTAIEEFVEVLFFHVDQLLQ